MKTLQFNENNQGFLVLSDTETGQLYYPSDIDGNFLNIRPEFYLSIKFVGDGREVFPINFINEAGLGWIAQAINAVASIGSSVIGSRASKKANEAAAQQLQAQQQIELLRAQSAERQAALLSQQQKKGMSTGAVVGIAVAGAAVVGGILYLVSSSNKDKKSNKKSLDGVQPKQSANKTKKIRFGRDAKTKHN